jgi:signal transduction histidine kinase/ligand-binding sensor domain-containing protein/DNA-binding response OmpR family regulator
MKTHLYLLLLSFFFLPANILLNAQEQFSTRYNITYVTMDNGLLHNFIDDIYKDKQGFLWISTGGGGLSRYDGYEFVHYNTNTLHIKLKSNFIGNTCEDDFGRLWIVSESGIDILNLSTLRSVILEDPKEVFPNLINQSAIRVIKDNNGCMWLCCGNSLHKIAFDHKGNIAKIFTLPTPLPQSLQYIAMCDADKDGNIWVGIGNTVCKLYSTEDEKLQASPVAPCLKFENGTIVSAFKVKDNEVWIGTNKGLIRYSRNEETAKHYEYEKNNTRSLSQNHITDFAITNNKQLLISTLKGINIYNPATDDFEQIIQENKLTTNCLNSNFVNCMLTDGDIIWIGTESGGINKMTPRNLSVRNYIYNKDNSYSLSKNPVNAIYEDMKGNLWVGTVEGGLNRKAKENDRFIHYTSDSPSKLGHNSVSAITADAANRLWVGTWGNGISLFDLNHPEYPAIKYISSQTHPGFPIDFIGSLCYDPINKGVWIGTNPGIYFYQFATEKLLSLFSNKTVENAPGAIGAIIDPQGKLWMGCMEGVYIIDLHAHSGNQFSYRHLKYKLDDPTSCRIEKISCFYLADDGTLWIGSNGYGIYKYIPEERGSGSFISYTTDQGLINNSIRGILEDEKGCLWISTNNGLSCFDTTSNRFTNYTKEDGLLGNQFYWNAYYRSQSGLLYFGEIDGLVAVDPRRRLTQIPPTKVTLTKLRVVNEEIFPGINYIDTDISQAKTLHLHERDKSFSLEFSALNFKSQATAIYSYRLAGFDDHWTEVPTGRRFAGYTNLPSGKYIFQVKYSLEGVTEDTPVTELTIIVSPFFYKTTWFILLMILLSAYTIFYIYKRRIRILQSQKELLHRTVEERTHELEQQKLILENQTKELSRQNDMLTRQNEKITRQKTQLIRMSKKVQELTIDKLSFFTNITHEFRTPITLIMGPIEKALKLSYNPKVIEQLNFVERNSKYLLSLVNQLMDFRKVESGNLEIVKIKGDFLKFIDTLLLPFEIFAGERNINIRKLSRLRTPDILFDQDAMQKVITNLFSNAIKFTPDGGTVSLYIATLTDKEAGKEKLYINVKDTGTGITEEDLTKIFNRFYQSSNRNKFPIYGQSGTGIGLYLSKRIVQLHGGNIEARNNRKVGCSFRVTLLLPHQESSLAEDKTITSNTSFPHIENLNLIPSHFTSGHLTILIVEDNKDMRNYIRSILSEHYNTLEAENGIEAISILSTSNVDFIISDLMMPLMDGIELSRQVKANFSISHIPFLMLTAKTAMESRLESYRTGVDEYLLKPFNEELLLTRITNILENRKRYRHQFAISMNPDALQMEEESSDKKFLNKALQIIKENYRNSYYEISDFIEAMGISKSLLNKKMQQIIGQSIGQFVRNYRLNVARDLIEKSRVTKNMNISEIAYEVGFNDPKYFTRCFTKHFNITPSSLMDENE